MKVLSPRRHYKRKSIRHPPKLRNMLFFLEGNLIAVKQVNNFWDFLKNQWNLLDFASFFFMCVFKLNAYLFRYVLELRSSVTIELIDLSELFRCFKWKETIIQLFISRSWTSLRWMLPKIAVMSSLDRDEILVVNNFYEVTVYFIVVCSNVAL